ncbi:hypothetical protein [Kribbella deserti]|uniref:DUF4129 domain-containing protein n=1 Tax=Kribbella deserti TaxID=1926257 RepID=A0ABV6QSA2_9ACTN
MITNRRLAAQHLGISLGVALLLVLAFSVLKYQPKPAWFVAVAVAIGLVSLAVRLIGRQLTQTSWPEKSEPYAGAWRNNDSRAQFLATWLQESHRDPETFTRRVQPLLTELAANRLRGRHGVDLAAEPGRAREMLGAETWDLITATEPSTVTYGRIERAIESIENL